MEISSIRIFLNQGTSESKVKGVAHVVLNNAIILRRIHLVENENEAGAIRISYPVYHLQTMEEHRRCFYASTEESLSKLNEAIMDAYRKVQADPENNTVVYTSQDAPEAPFKITNSAIYPHNDPDSNTAAKVNVELDGEIWLRGMYLVKREDGTMYLRMPRRTHADGKRVDIYHPRSQAARDMLTEAVMPLYEAAVKAAEDSDGPKTAA